MAGEDCHLDPHHRMCVGTCPSHTMDTTCMMVSPGSCRCSDCAYDYFYGEELCFRLPPSRVLTQTPAPGPAMATPRAGAMAAPPTVSLSAMTRRRDMREVAVAQSGRMTHHTQRHTNNTK
ncbi:hypothetical protein KIPB_001969, partial [Kipferlia bialata]|eukprot:g1969.t1